MDEREKELLAAYRGEAASLFAANQAQRNAAERVANLILATAAIAVAAGVSAHTLNVAIPVPPFLLLLLAYMLNQYADLTAMGMARRQIEDRANNLLRAPVLIYETHVAGIRQQAPLVRSVRLAQGFMVLVVGAAVGVGTAAALENGRWYVEAAYGLFTASSLVTVLVAYQDMMQTNDVVTNALTASLSEAEKRYCSI